MTTSAPTATSRTTFIRPILEEFTGNLLRSVDCVHVYSMLIPPITTQEQFKDFLAIQEGFDQSKLEAWYVAVGDFRNDPQFRGTWSQYGQRHEVKVTGWVWHNNFQSSYKYIHDQVEKIVWTLEKNKGGGSSEVNEISGVEARFRWQKLGEIYLHTSEVQFIALLTVTEPSGRV